jgi:hypothetical protein
MTLSEKYNQDFYFGRKPNLPLALGGSGLS